MNTEKINACTVGMLYAISGAHEWEWVTCECGNEYQTRTDLPKADCPECAVYGPPRKILRIKSDVVSASGSVPVVFAELEVWRGTTCISIARPINTGRWLRTARDGFIVAMDCKRYCESHEGVELIDER